MYVLDAVRVLRRRWLVLFVGLVILVGGAAAVHRYVPTQYQASGQLILLLPPDVEIGDPTNPYLNQPPGLTTTASLLAGGAMTQDAQRVVERSGFGSEFDVAVVPGAGPVLIVTTKDTDPNQALGTRNAVMMRIQKELARIQAEVGVPKRQLISATPSSVGEVAEPLPR